jgi:diadenosine tetraphosphate (Ap4A) HIT family hydrolase
MASYTEHDVIFETQNFILTRCARPLVSREEGGHMRIFAKRQGLSERRDFTPEEAVEFIWLSSLAGEALEKGLNKRGIPVVKINFQEMGNWAFKTNDRVVFHEHIFGRAKDSKNQVFPEAVQLPDRSSGFYEGFEPLDDEDMKAIRSEIETLLTKSKYANTAYWHMQAK